MQQILLTNIGNRNIRLDGKYLDLKNNNGKNFKEYTKELSEQLNADYDQIRPRLSLEILPNFITGMEQIILFATDQQNHDLGFQDTCYEAIILKTILEKEEGKKVDILTFRENPADEFATYRYFSRALREFRQEGTNGIYLVNDAGGTPHMKQALKDLCEFFFPDCCKIVYTNQQDQKHEVNRWNSKKYILLSTTAEFVRNYNYQAAFFIVKNLQEQLNLNDVRPISDELFSYLDIAAQRLNFNKNKAMNIQNRLNDDNALKNNALIKFYLEGRSYEISKSIPFSQMSAKARNDIFEIASICQLYFSEGNYTFAVATLYRFMEEVCQSFIESEGVYNIQNSYYKNKFIETVTSQVKAKFRHLQPSAGLPFMMGYVSIKADRGLRNLITFFIKLTSHIDKKNGNKKGINILRNSCFLAHGNEPIDKEVLDKEFPNLLQDENWLVNIFTICKMPETNIYDQMNEEILELIFNE